MMTLIKVEDVNKLKKTIKILLFTTMIFAFTSILFFFLWLDLVRLSGYVNL